MPDTTKVNKVIPKNAFDAYANSKQKRLFTDLIARITWTHKLSSDTLNIESKDISEIQLFRIELKQKREIQSLLNLMDKAIPYHIIFVVEYDSMMFLSTSCKHPHPLNEDNAIIDYTFKTEWFEATDNKYNFDLRISIDAVYHNFCIQLSGYSGEDTKSLVELSHFSSQVNALEREIAKIKSNISASRHFKKKVDLNLQLKAKESQLQSILLGKRKNPSD